MPETLFLRLLAHEDKAAAMAEALAAVREGDSTNPVVHLVDPRSFRQVPGSPFAYWVSEALRRKFTELPAFEGEGRTVKQGLATADDFRFVRAWWEVAAARILDGGNGPRGDLAAFQQWCRDRTFQGKRWAPFAKGGEYSPYYADVHLVVNWHRGGEEIKNRLNPETGKTYSNVWQLKGTERDYFFRPGLTWPKLPHKRGSFRILPGGCIFSHGGMATFAPDEQLLPLTAILNSSAYLGLLGLLMARGTVGGQTMKYEVGYVVSVPIPLSKLAATASAHLTALADESARVSRDLDCVNETSHAFCFPSLLHSADATLARRLGAWEARTQHAEQILAGNQAEIDEIAYHIYDVSSQDRQAIEASLRAGGASPTASNGGEGTANEEPEETEVPGFTVDHHVLLTDLLSYALGCALGRWDIRIALNPSLAPKLADPFAPLPVCSPGMLVGADGLPAQPNRIASEAWLRARPDAITLPEEGAVGRPTIADEEYPLRVAWDGSLVDDPDHPDDVVRRVREALEVLWGERAEAVEREACALLGVKGLRDYFRNPRGFFDHHVKRYSKSRRKAPIYWLLQSDRRNYGLWLSYHRLDQDTPFKALQGYVAPKLAREESRLRALRRALESGGASGAAHRQQERQVDEQEALVLEITRFQETLRGVANLHLAPDLDDGVLLSIAPLHALVPWKEAKQAWQELLAGKYGWSTMGRRMRERGLVAR